MSQSHLTMKGIRKAFQGVQALKGIDLEVLSGEVLAIVGANGAGKSTLMNVLGGVVRPDEGRVLIKGFPVHIHSPLDAARHGIAFVHQEMSLLPTMTVLDNIHIASFPKTRAGLIDYPAARTRCQSVLGRLGCTFAPSTKVRDLSPGNQQMVEIARALLCEPHIIIFDEPTSSLTTKEKSRLFEVIGSLKRDGVAVIYISHFMDEIFGLCDRAIVLRDGQVVGGAPIGELSYDKVVELMIGRSSSDAMVSPKDERTLGEVVLAVDGLSREGVLDDISFVLRKGEVLGLWGLMGSGRTELARAIVGLDPVSSGSITVRDEKGTRALRPREAQSRIGMVTENRREEGLLLPMPVRDNISLANLRALVSRIWPFIDTARETSLAQHFVDRLKILISHLGQPVGTLSGGNQQKVVVSRWLQRNPPIYIMDEPTRGLDVGAKAEMRGIIKELAQAGSALLVISSEIEEIMSLGTRYLVMHRGRIVRELPGDASKSELMAAAIGAR